MTPSPALSAYIPCFNNAETIAQAVEGVRKQTHPIDDLFVVDDGSTDDSVALVEAMGVKVIRIGSNLGRGNARATAMEAARHELVLCGDATNCLSPDFVQKSLKWFEDERILAVYGRCYDRHPLTIADRWRARHLYKQQVAPAVKPRGWLATYGAIVRKSAVAQVGNYNRAMRHGEDHELGGRLLKVGSVISDPALEVQPLVHNTLLQVMERYARWNRVGLEVYDLRQVIRSHITAWRILIPRDLAERDWPCALITATMPYFCFAYADKKTLRFYRKPPLK